MTRLDPADIEAIAQRVVELQAAHAPVAVAPETQMLTTADTAAIVGYSCQWVREHRAELGGVPSGDGPRARLRFPRAAVARYVAGQGAEKATTPDLAKHTPNRRRDGRTPAGNRFLAVKDASRKRAA